ncbi:MAG: hypothetical protein N3F63_02315 [Thermoplasmata archaeon]|nr:hypothetical protein [Thermoplasmata archaeon]
MAEGKKSTIRTEVVRAITDLVNDKEARERIDKGILAHTKGREHWILHLLLKALEAQQEYTETGMTYLLTTTNTVYKDLGAKIEGVNKEIENSIPKIKAEVGEIEAKNYERLVAMIEESFKKVNEGLGKTINESIGKTAEAINTQALETKNLTQALSRDVADTFKVATQVRLLISENMRKLNEIAEALERGGTGGTPGSSGEIYHGAGDIKPLIEKIEGRINELKGFEEKMDTMLKSVNKHIDVTSIETQHRIENLSKGQVEIVRRVEAIEKTMAELKVTMESLRTLLLEIKK